jgi:DNA-binding transcriptional ArsR family regulator
MPDDIVISRDVFKTVSADTRLDILKLLDKRQMTASELSRLLNKHVTTITEHLELLRKSNMVERVQRPGHKWVYYRLTSQASNMVHPRIYKKLVVVLSVSVLIMVGVAIPFVDANPGDFLYPIETYVESAQLALADDEGKAMLYLMFADKRLAEVKTLTSANASSRHVEETLTRYRNSIEASNSIIQNIEMRRGPPEPLLEEFDEVSSKHISALENLERKVPEISEDVGPALDTLKQSKDRVRKSISSIYGSS